MGWANGLPVAVDPGVDEKDVGVMELLEERFVINTASAEPTRPELSSGVARKLRIQLLRAEIEQNKLTDC